VEVPEELALSAVASPAHFGHSSAR